MSRKPDADGAPDGERRPGRPSRVWPDPRQPPRGATPGEVLSWGVFTTALGTGLIGLTGAGPERTGMLGGLGLAATAVLWLAARSAARPRGRRRRDGPTERR